jgi:hypothetical protein
MVGYVFWGFDASQQITTGLQNDPKNDYLLSHDLIDMT